jgi:hypothetical protein
MGKSEVILTVPASFDAVARELTMEAARLAELERVTLLEEPQAAFYCWLDAQGAGWKQALGGASVLLVCDVGGGTTDFTLVVVTSRAGEIRPIRVAVGDHLLLGGDNMDLAIAHHMEVKLAGGPGRMEPDEWGELVHASRMAKEDLLTRNDLPSARISVLGRGSSLVGGTRSGQLTRAELERVVLDGFFPRCEPQAVPAAVSPLGLKEFGLPYAAEPAVTRHLAQFLRGASEAASDALGRELPAGRPVRPDGVLFNGGVFAAGVLRDRVIDCLKGWFPEEAGYEPARLACADLGLAVARGAAYFAVARRGHGVRIGGGAARSYYIGLGSRPNSDETPKTLCVVPRGMEEGETVDIPERTFKLIVGQTVRFPLQASSSRSHDRVGDLIEAGSPGLLPLPAFKTALESGAAAGGEVDVQLRASLTAMGTLGLECHTPDGAGKWQLELELRPAGGLVSSEGGGPGAAVQADVLESARAMTRAVFGGGRGFGRDPEGLRRRLEEALGSPREDWDTALLRELWRTLDEMQGGRGRGPAHERQWLQSTGWCLRPGFGDPLDAGRLDRLWSLAGGKLRFGREEGNHRAYWVMWRRVAPGLDAVRQAKLLERVKPSLMLGDRKTLEMQGVAATPGVQAEMWRLAATLERLGPAQKVELGERMLSLLEGERPPDHGFWVMARLAARQPVTGAVHQSVGRAVVTLWVPRLMRLVRVNAERASFAVAHAARRTGDRYRDLSEGQRREVLHRLRQLDIPPRHVQMVAEVVELGAAEQGALLGDVVPPGLRLG